MDADAPMRWGARGFREIAMTARGWTFDSGLLRVTANFFDQPIPFEEKDVPMVSRLGTFRRLRPTCAPWEAVATLR